MRFISLTALGTKAAETLRRFPLPLLAALAATIALICLNHADLPKDEGHVLARLAMASYLCMLLTISVSLYIERFVFDKAKRYIVVSLSLLLVALYYLSLPAKADDVSAMRFPILIIALHLLVSFSPFLIRGEMNGMWQFNKSLFIRFLTSGVYSGVLFAGLALALLAVDKLFDVHIDEEYYFDLFLVIAGIFNTWFFLSGVPKAISTLEESTDYPKGLRVFTSFVLIPLITVYMVILYAYAAKILITADWPVGWVAYMVIAFSIFGILSFLLVYPLRNDGSNPWVKFYSRLFYFLLIPPIALLYVSIFKRINMYGITEERYFVLILAVWLSFIALYFILTSGRQIRVIPLSLSIVAFLSCFGPWGAFAVSLNSQKDELTILLDNHHVLVNGKVDTTRTHDAKSKEYDRIDSIVSYICDMHGHDKLQSFFDQNLDSAIAVAAKEGLGPLTASYAVFHLLQLTRVETDDGDIPYIRYNSPRDVMLKSAGFDYFMDYYMVPESHDDENTRHFTMGLDSISSEYSLQSLNIRLTCRDFEPLELDLKKMLKTLPPSKTVDVPIDRLTVEVSPDLLTVESGNPQWKARLVFSDLSAAREKGTTKISQMNGYLMIKIL